MTENDAFDTGNPDEVAKRKALQIAGEAFGHCEEEGIDGIIAVGVFLDHIIAHLVSMNDKTVTAEFLETLANRVRDGIYDHAVGEVKGEGMNEESAP